MTIVAAPVFLCPYLQIMCCYVARYVEKFESGEGHIRSLLRRPKLKGFLVSRMQ